MKHLPPVQQKFVLHWGEMGARWGINRTVAQVHALLHLSEAPISADAISSALGVARSNVRTSLDQRKRREIDPTLDMLRKALDELDRGKSGDRYTRERLQELLEFFDTM